MRLLEHVRVQQAPATPRCRTCLYLAKLTTEDRQDFIDAHDAGIPGSVIAAAVNARLAELGIDGAVGAGSVRTHIREKHSA